MRGGRADRQQEIADLMRFGIGEADAKAFFEVDEAETEFGLWPANAEAYRVFHCMWRRWVFNPMTGQRLCMDLQQLESVLRLLRIPGDRRSAIFDQMVRCEGVVLDEMPAPDRGR